ncbi:MAG: glycosyltransferase family 2 protein [Methylophilaceae bacterium]
MCTYNGEKFLAEQLDSIKNQSHQNWRLIISDDGSTDATLAIAKQYQKTWGGNLLEIRNGPQQGFCDNFLSLACNSTINADLYAFSDQDDVWLAEKLCNAVEYFNASSDNDLPRVYGTRTKIVDERLKAIGLSPLFTLPRSFRNALVQSIAGGNTMVFNQQAKCLLEKLGMQKIVSHDWWLYLLVKGAGGVVFYDPEPCLLYRQHDDALIGANSSFRARVSRVGYVLNSRFKDWNDINLNALTNAQHLFTKDNQDILETYRRFRGARFKDRIRLLEVCGLYRQTWQGTLSLWLATILNKI